MKDCCLAVIERYRAIIGQEQEGAALFCKECTSRLVLREGVWGTEGAMP